MPAVRQTIHLPAEHRRFLASFERGAPNWDLLGLPKVDRLPAIQWRERNLDKITKNKRASRPKRSKKA